MARRAGPRLRLKTRLNRSLTGFKRVSHRRPFDLDGPVELGQTAPLPEVLYKTSSLIKGSPMTAPHLLVHDRSDNVGVVVTEGVAAGQELFGVVLDGDSEFRITANVDTPIGHKIALRDLQAGSDAVKYGQVIGRIVADVRTGDHVHVHNLKTKRW
jgi:(2R)-sulfolactate sulfo-lyase subunit alpha